MAPYFHGSHARVGSGSLQQIEIGIAGIYVVWKQFVLNLLYMTCSWR